MRFLGRAQKCKCKYCRAVAGSAFLKASLVNQSEPAFSYRSSSTACVLPASRGGA